MMKKVLLGGLFGGVCFVAGQFVIVGIQMSIGKDTLRKLCSGDKKYTDLTRTELIGLLTYLRDYEIYTDEEGVVRYKGAMDD